METLFQKDNLNKGGSGGSNKQPIELKGIKFESKTKAAEYISETEGISFTAKKRIQVNRIDVRPPSKSGEGVYKKSLTALESYEKCCKSNSNIYQGLNYAIDGKITICF